MNSKNLKDFGVFFSEVREKSGYRSQRELAEKSGVSHSTINRIESGSHRASPETLSQLASYLKDVTYEELLERLGYIDLFIHDKDSNEVIVIEAKSDFLPDSDPKIDPEQWYDPDVQFIARSKKEMSPKAFQKMMELAKKAKEMFEDEE